MGIIALTPCIYKVVCVLKRLLQYVCLSLCVCVSVNLCLCMSVRIVQPIDGKQVTDGMHTQGIVCACACVYMCVLERVCACV